MKVSIGIDPGKTTGFAVYDIEDDILTLRDTTFWEVFELIYVYPKSEIYEITVEVPNSKTVWHSTGANQKTAARTGVNVGSVLREAELLAEGLERYGYNVRRVHPRGKVDAKKFNAFTGFTKRSNQHQRDAGLMCFRRKPSSV
jgi:hypothetical protein